MVGLGRTGTLTDWRMTAASHRGQPSTALTESLALSVLIVFIGSDMCVHVSYFLNQMWQRTALWGYVCASVLVQKERFFHCRSIKHLFCETAYSGPYETKKNDMFMILFYILQFLQSVSKRNEATVHSVLYFSFYTGDMTRIGCCRVLLFLLCKVKASAEKFQISFASVLQNIGLSPYMYNLSILGCQLAP